MATSGPKRITAEEFWEWGNRPENYDRHCELVRGQIVDVPLPGKLHGFVCAQVAGVVGEFVRRRRRGYLCTNGTGVITQRKPDTVRGPDVLVFDETKSFEELEDKWVDHPPAVVAEVLGPDDTASDVNRRVREQLCFGTRLVWVIDPEVQTVTVYAPGRYSVLGATDELSGEDVLPDFRCRVAEFFALPGR